MMALTPPLGIASTPTISEQPAAPDVGVLRRQLDETVRLYHDDRYEATALLLPEMITAAHAAVASYGDEDHDNEALLLRSDVLQLAGWFLTQVRASDLAYQALKEAITDANTAGDVLAAASG
jgi:hypothetical protein